MDTPSLNIGQSNPNEPKYSSQARPPQNDGLISDGLKTILIFALLIAVGYILFDSYRFQQESRTEITKLQDKLKELENKSKVGEVRLSSLKGEISETQEAVGSTKAELRKTAAHAVQIQSDNEKAKMELTEALATKADSAAVEARVASVKSETDTKIGQVSSEVGGVKSEVGTVRTELATTRRDLEGTQRSVVDVRESLTAAVAKNSGELAELRRKGEREYFEFELPRKNQSVKVEDLYLVLTKTDPKKGKYSLRLVVDDNRLDKNDRTVNEPVQFLVGRNRIRYEIVVNWVQKDKIGGYLSYPKDKALASERPKQ
jgi:septal ring factor EnvC (AmiA/AmiB activator)